MNILIAEDDVVSRRILQKTLENLGHTITACENGEAAWTAYQTGDFRLIVSDWMMPGLDGLELCRKIRSLKRHEYIYVILLTAKSGKENFLEGMEAGADDYLTKPVDLAELKVRLEAAQRILGLEYQVKDNTARILRLQTDVQNLRRILPICAWCKKIRDDRQLWHSVEEYISTHSDVDFSHAICPECAEKQAVGLPKKSVSSGA